MGEHQQRERQDSRPVERQRTARLAGAAYVVTIVAGIFAEVYVRGSLLVPGDAIATAASIVSADKLYRLSIFADLVMLGCYVVVTALLYRLFRPSGRTLSLCAACFSLTGITMLAASMAFLVLPTILLGDASYLASVPPQQRAALAYASLRVHGSVYGFTGIFFGLYCLAIGWLILRSRELPPLVGWLMALAGATFLFDTGLELIAPSLAKMVPDVVTGISLLGEGLLAIWLTLFGISRPRLMADRNPVPERPIGN